LTQVHAIKLGVIGLGSIGMRHANNLMSMGYEVLAYDPSLQRCELFEQAGGAPVKNKQNISESCDAVVIASPSSMHLEDLAWAVENGIHAFIEKPLAHTLQGLEEICADAEKRKLVLSLGMNMRFNPAIKRLSAIIRDGGIGDILWANYWHSSFLPDWRPDADFRKGYAADPKTGGVIFDVIHGFDLLYFLIGNYTVCGATARSSNVLEISSDDCADILCRHTTGVTSTLHMDFITRPKSHVISVAGTNAIARIDISRRHLSLTGIGGHIIEENYFDTTSVNDDYCQELKDFINAIQGSNLEGCSLLDGMNVLSNVVLARKMAGLPYVE